MSVTTADPASVPFEPGARPAPATPEMTPRGLAFSAALHAGIVALVAVRAAVAVPPPAAAGDADRGAAGDDRAGDPRHPAQPVQAETRGQARAAGRRAGAETGAEARAAAARRRAALGCRAATDAACPETGSKRAADAASTPSAAAQAGRSQGADPAASAARTQAETAAARACGAAAEGRTRRLSTS